MSDVQGSVVVAVEQHLTVAAQIERSEQALEIAVEAPLAAVDNHITSLYCEFQVFLRTGSIATATLCTMILLPCSLVEHEAADISSSDILVEEQSTIVVAHIVECIVEEHIHTVHHGSACVTILIHRFGVIVLDNISKVGDITIYADKVGILESFQEFGHTHPVTVGLLVDIVLGDSVQTVDEDVQ